MSGQSPKGGNCPVCKERAERHQKSQEAWLDEGEKLLALALKQGKRVINKRHADSRGVQRCFSMKQIETAIKNGFIIERNFNQMHNNAKWLIISSIKIAPKKYRPIHVSISIDEETITVITEYDPRSMPWKWNDSFTERVCWCKKDEDRV